MRGQRVNQTLFSEFEPQADQEAEQWKRGRNEELLRKRNKKLCARMYWYKTYLNKLDYDAILLEMQDDFDISAMTIANILLEPEWMGEQRRVFNQAPDIKQLRKEYPKIVWDPDVVKNGGTP